MTEQPIVIFLHLPKTAGITFTDVLRRQYGDKLWNPHHVTVENLASLTEEQTQSLMACHGEMFYGIHELFLPRPSRYVVFLRDPVDRMVSWYYYVRRKRGDWFHEIVTSKNMSLEDFVHFIGDNNYDNQQTRWIAGYEPAGERRTLKQIAVPDISDFPLEPIRDEWLEVAKQNIVSHFIAGLTERFDETLLLAKHEFGWKDVYYSRRNVTKDRPMRDGGYPEHVVNLIQEQEYLDVALYDFAKARFEEQIAAMGDLLKQDVATFQRSNKMYNLARKVYHNIPESIRPVAKRSLGRAIFGRGVED